MSKCTVCKVGNLTQSGSHQYCDRCNYISFVVTDDYLEACKNLLAVLASNTSFMTEEDFQQSVRVNISSHLPHLDTWILSTVSGRKAIMDDIYKAIRERAINVEDSELVCKCGCTEFNMLNIAHLSCKNCGTQYLYDEETGFYKPYFNCECGSNNYNVEEQKAGLVSCFNCGMLFMHDSTNGIFRKVVG